VQEIKQSIKLTWWPSPQDYNEAIQNAHANLGDAELQASHVELDKLGLPRPMTGAFASVYRMKGTKRDIALRCFLRNISDNEQRYGMISKFVESDDLPYTVGFDFVPKGIRVNSEAFPVLKMEYVDGIPLDTFIKQNAKDAMKLARLAEAFAVMCDDLRGAGIAHGDLQHGNILVVGDELRLVDYDGMFVPGMENMQSNELGHPNYQHPGRCASDFGPYLDSFSAWVIYASLRSISIDPSLAHDKLIGLGDDCLLFRRDDFVYPEYSRTFSILESNRNAEVAALAKCVRWQLKQAPSAVPPLSRQLPEIGSLPRVTPKPREQRVEEQKPVPKSPSKLPDWIANVPFVSVPSTPGPQAAAMTSAPQPPMQPGIPRGLNQRIPRRARFVSNRGRMSPIDCQWWMAANPAVWAVLFFMFIAIPVDQELVRGGFERQATVTAMTEHLNSKKRYYEVDYSYKVGTQQYSGDEEVSPYKVEAMGLKVGDRFAVRALPSDPSTRVVSLTDGMYGTQDAANGRLNSDQLLSWLLIGVNLILEFFIWYKPLRHRDFVRKGTAARGRITEKKIVTGSKNSKSYFLYYRFSTSRGIVQNVRMPVDQSQYNQANENDRITVLYDVNDPYAGSVIYEYGLYEAV
jgi:hypothetical protein